VAEQFTKLPLVPKRFYLSVACKTHAYAWGYARGLLAVVFKYSKLNQTFRGMFPMKKEVRITVVGKVWNANFAQ